MSYQITRRKFLSDDEQAQLGQTLALIKPVRTRDVLMIELALKSGGRASEILAVRKRDLSHETLPTGVVEGHVSLIGLKGSYDRSVPIPLELYKDLERFAQNLNANDRLFPITLRRLQAIWHDVRPCPKGFHSLRHTCAVNIQKRVGNVMILKQVLGHKVLANTQVYADFVYSTEELRKIL